MPGAGDSTWRTWRHAVQGLGFMGLGLLGQIKVLSFNKGFFEVIGLLGLLEV